MVSTVASQHEGPGLNLGPLCVEFACSSRVWVSPGCIGFLPVCTTLVSAPEQGTSRDLELVPGCCIVAAHCS